MVLGFTALFQCIHRFLQNLLEALMRIEGLPFVGVCAVTVFAENREEAAFIWENWFDEDEGINEYDLSIFVRQEGDQFLRFTETHYQKAWPQERVCGLLQESGLKLLHVYEAFSEQTPGEKCERLCFIARESGK